MSTYTLIYIYIDVQRALQSEKVRARASKTENERERVCVNTHIYRGFDFGVSFFFLICLFVSVESHADYMGGEDA